MPRAAFRPRPRVDSSFVTLRAPPRTRPEEAAVAGRVRRGGAARAPRLRPAAQGAHQLAGRRAPHGGVTLTPRRRRARAATRSALSAGGAAGGALAAAMAGVRRGRWAGDAGRATTAGGGGMTASASDAVGRVEVAAPAKLNLALLVGPLRPDGFHEIASLMVPVTLADHGDGRAHAGRRGWTSSARWRPASDNLAAEAGARARGASGRALRGARDHRQARPARRRPRRRQLRRGRHAASRSSGSSTSTSRRVCATRSPRRWARTCPSSSGPARSSRWAAARCSRTSSCPPLHFVIAVPDLALPTAAGLRLARRGRRGDLRGVRAAARRLLGARAEAAPRSCRRRRAGAQRPRGERRRAPAGGRRAARRACSATARWPRP